MKQLRSLWKQHLVQNRILSGEMLARKIVDAGRERPWIENSVVSSWRITVIVGLRCLPLAASCCITLNFIMFIGNLPKLLVMRNEQTYSVSSIRPASVSLTFSQVGESGFTPEHEEFLTSLTSSLSSCIPLLMHLWASTKRQACYVISSAVTG